MGKIANIDLMSRPCSAASSSGSMHRAYCPAPNGCETDADFTPVLAISVNAAELPVLKALQTSSNEDVKPSLANASAGGTSRVTAALMTDASI